MNFESPHTHVWRKGGGHKYHLVWWHICKLYFPASFDLVTRIAFMLPRFVLWYYAWYGSKQISWLVRESYLTGYLTGHILFINAILLILCRHWLSWPWLPTRHRLVKALIHRGRLILYYSSITYFIYTYVCMNECNPNELIRIIRLCTCPNVADLLSLFPN